jgi:apolipoprotein N-acyltransferase
MTNILILIAGATGVLAFSPFKLWWMSIISLSLLLCLLIQSNYHRGFKAGFIYGLGFFGLGTSWVFNSFSDFGDAPFIVALTLTVALVLVQSCFTGLVIFFYAKTVRKNVSSVTAALAFVSLWVVFEWSRGWFLTGFPWLLYGQGLVDSPLKGIIPLLGTFGGSALVALLAVGLTQLLVGDRRTLRYWLPALVVIVVGVIFSSGVNWTRPAQEQPVKVAAVQANIDFELKWDKSRRNIVYDTYADLTRQHWDSEIIVWPETAIPTFYKVAEQSFIPEFEPEVIDNGSEVLAGIFTFDEETEQVFNSMVSLGGERQFYHKKHLVPFGEYLPFRWLLEIFQKFVNIPMSDLSSGEGDYIVELSGIPVGVSICYEAAFGEEIIQSFPEAQLLVNVSNDAWFGDSLAPHQHLQIARVRSLESGRYMIRATNTGISALIDDKGNIIKRSGQFVKEVVSGKVMPMKGSTPFIMWGNWVVVNISFMILLITYLRTKQYF